MCGFTHIHHILLLLTLLHTQTNTTIAAHVASRTINHTAIGIVIHYYSLYHYTLYISLFFHFKHFLLHFLFISMWLYSRARLGSSSSSHVFFLPAVHLLYRSILLVFCAYSARKKIEKEKPFTTTTKISIELN